jgi:3-oxoacyl-[acyl-carrier protein] reductase
VALPGVDLGGRVALVVGGARGVGAAIAELLGAAGAEVAVADDDAAALARIEARSAYETFECQFEDPAAVAEMLAGVRERLGRLDALAWARPAGSAAELEAASHCVAEAARLMTAGGGGRIVLVGSTGDSDLPNLVRTTAAELAPQRVAVNAVLAGAIRGELPDAELAERVAANPSGMAGEPEDVARAALWLLDPENAFVTGATVVVDGGESSL